jgi:SAM-dependent methyltransferase
VAIIAGDTTMRAHSRATGARGIGAAGCAPAEPHPHALETLRPLIACPACAAEEISIDTSLNALRCAQCDTRFPYFRCGKSIIPWLFAEPDTTRLEWKARYNGFLHANASQQERLKKALGESRNSIAGRRRINRQLKGRKQHREQVTRLIAPLGLSDIDWPADATDLLHKKLPRNQGLSSYSANIFRDWAWENGENEAMISAVDGVLKADSRDCIGSVLTLGAGACRLSYDLHHRYSATSSVVADINPLLLQIASEVIGGETVSLYEFPLAPLNEASFAVPQKCRAPGRPEKFNDADFLFVLADALDPPFARDSFDTVVTPWLIDIVPQDVRQFIPRINQILPVGGVWVNTGSLAFFHKEVAWCYSEEEVLSLVEENGFELLSVERQTIPYLQSPLSAHGRIESVLSFSARKYEEAGIPDTYSYMPDWVIDTSLAVPTSPDIVVSSSSHLLSAQVLAIIDGKRTINQIARAVASQYGLGTPETIHAVKRILVDAWEENCFEEE